MLYIGIDVAKDKHECCIISSQGEILCELFSFDNTLAGFESFIQLVSSFSKDNQLKKVGLEATGHYSTNLISFLQSNSFEVVVLNPLAVNRARLASTLRKTKTDKSDARHIAQMLMFSNTKSYPITSYHISELKSLTRARFRLTKEIQPLKNRYRRLIHLTFPEIQRFFSKMDLNVVLNLLEALPSAKSIAECNILKLTNILIKHSKGRIKRNKAEALKALAKNSIATYNAGDSFELKLAAQRIMFLENQKNELEQRIQAIMDSIPSTITTIPGIGVTLGAIIIAEIGDIHAFSNPAKLLAFAGCEPSTYQSGQFTATNTPMVKRGSRYLRNALYLATNYAYLHSRSFNAYINLKRSQGKHHYVAMSHGMKKMVRVIFAILSANKPFLEPI